MTVFIPLSTPEQKPAAAQKPDDISRFARVAMLIGGLLSFAFTVACLAVALYGWFPNWKTGAGIWLGLLACAWIAAAFFGAWWTYNFRVKRPAKFEDDENKYKFQIHETKSAEPEPIYIEPQTVKVEIIDKTDGKHQMLLLDLPCSRSALYEVAKLIASGKSFSEASMTGKDKPLARGENGNYAGVRDEFIGRGLLRWKDEENPNQGLEVTKAGMAYFRHLANHSPTAPINGAHARENKG